MNKITIIGAITVVIVVVSCAAGGAVFAIKMGNSNDDNIQTNANIKVEELKQELKEGWKHENGSWYFYKNNEKQIEWIEDKNSWYYLGNDGKMRSGWIKDKDQWYYLNSDGTMATNTTIEGCYINSNGLIEETPTKVVQSSKPSEDNDNITYKTYTNKRFGYSIDYPSNLIPGSGGANGAGFSFKSADGSVSLGVCGMNNAAFQTTEQHYNDRISRLTVKPSYKHLESNSYTLSWEENGKIFYEYFILGDIYHGAFNEFSFEYPANKKEYYDPIVSRIRSSFKNPGIDSSH